MISDSQNNGLRNLKVRTVMYFTAHFRIYYNATIVRESQYWKEKDEIASRHQYGLRSGSKAATCSSNSGIWKFLREPRNGKGRKRALWFTERYALMEENFERLRKEGVTFDWPLLYVLALEIISSSTSESLKSSSVDPWSNLPISQQSNGCRSTYLCSATISLLGIRLGSCWCHRVK